jgi:hypothetical protein
MVSLEYKTYIPHYIFLSFHKMAFIKFQIIDGKMVYIEFPVDFVGRRMRLHVALEIDVVSLLQVPAKICQNVKYNCA